MVAERTFVMVKPDGVGRRLIGRIIERYEAKGLKLVGLKMQIGRQQRGRGRAQDERRDEFAES